MVYFPELYYFFDTQGFLLEDAVKATAKGVGVYCTHYSAEILFPKIGVTETKREGTLPQGKTDKRVFIEELVSWIFENSTTPDLFELHFDTEKGGGKFDHHDDTCCWLLNLTEDEFDEVREEWKRNGLPEDLFYEEGREKRVQRPLNLFDKLLVRVGFTVDTTTMYTPKQWEAEKKK